MILIIGPAFSGKREFARKLLEQKTDSVVMPLAQNPDSEVTSLAQKTDSEVTPLVQNPDSAILHSGDICLRDFIEEPQNRECQSVERQDRELQNREPQILAEVQEMIPDGTTTDLIGSFADELCGKAVIMTASETGAGIVPIDPKDRERRELQGRLLTELASRAECVVRVFYGIPEVIKGKL